MSATSKILHLHFNPVPRKADVEELKQACKAALDLFAKIFCHHEDHACSFPPTTHGITCLHQNLSQCGHLLNLPQHAVKRLVGVLSAGVKSRKHPETQMLSSHQMRLSLQFVAEASAVEDLMESGREDNGLAAAGGPRLGPRREECEGAGGRLGGGRGGVDAIGG